MDDSKIIDLYWQRDERAIEETDSKYGAYCRAVSMNILGVREDAEECVSSPRGLEEITDARELGRILNGWLESLPRQDCADFMRRYWGGESVADIAAKRSATAWATSSTTGAITPRACTCTASGIPAGS